VGFHPNYICTFFKKAIGQSYLSCLHQERIAVAKELLSRTSNRRRDFSSCGLQQFHTVCPDLQEV
jgi:YesN/AraC family two-component response regulator